jgi:hypothetical protein
MNKNNSNFQIFLKTNESIEDVLIKKYNYQLNIINENITTNIDEK